MGFETMPDREFYLAVAAKHPSQLEDIVAGKAGFAETLGKLIISVRAQGDNALENLQGYLVMLGEFTAFEAKDITSTGSQAVDEYGSWTFGSNNCVKSKKKADTVGYSSLLSVLGGAALVLLLANPLGLALTAAGYCGILGAGVIKGEPKKKRRNALLLIHETVEPFCEQLDRCAVSTFAVNYFTNSREHFEQTYPLLEQEQRELVDDQLHSYLGAGGMTGMDQDQLNDYLTELQVPKLEPEGDA